MNHRVGGVVSGHNLSGGRKTIQRERYTQYTKVIITMELCMYKNTIHVLVHAVYVHVHDDLSCDIVSLMLHTSSRQCSQI